MRRTAEREGALANWRARLSEPRGGPKLLQYCHGAPGFVVCLGDFPDSSLDDLLEAGALATWQAGPLRKGSNLCHGTGGNGYALMYGIAQTEAALARCGRPRHRCGQATRGSDRFPTVDVFFG